MFFHGLKKIFSNNDTKKKELVDPFAIFSFAGKQVA
jgi:hypothetical protein